MDKETFELSKNLVIGVATETGEFIFEDLSEWRDWDEMYQGVEDAITEMRSWQKELLRIKNEVRNEND